MSKHQGNKKTIYMRPERQVLAEKVAVELFGGNLSALLDQGLDALIAQRTHRNTLIADAITTILTAAQTKDAAAAIRGHLLLAALFGAGDAEAIERTLQQITEHPDRQ